MIYDIVIPIHPKDFSQIDMLLISINKYLVNKRNIYLISSQNIDKNNVIWFNEEMFPFNKDFIKNKFHFEERTGWYYQQLLKLYSIITIPDILDYVLILDSDCLFLNETIFFDKNKILLDFDTSHHHEPYFVHMGKLLPELNKQNNVSGITHHILLNRYIIKDLFTKVGIIHNKPFWYIFCELVDEKNKLYSGASEYEIYFNYCLKYHKEKIKLRELKKNLFHDNISDFFYYKELGYNFIAVHAYNRSKLNTFGNIDNQIKLIKNLIKINTDEIDKFKNNTYSKLENYKINDSDKKQKFELQINELKNITIDLNNYISKININFDKLKSNQLVKIEDKLIKLEKKLVMNQEYSRPKNENVWKSYIIKIINFPKKIKNSIFLVGLGISIYSFILFY
jgi:hypothetical protein